MGLWQINADTLAGSRFVVSPLAETVSALNSLERARAGHPGERAWLDVHLPAYRARQAADPVAARLVPAALGGSWNADFITPTPTGRAPRPSRRSWPPSGRPRPSAPVRTCRYRSAAPPPGAPGP